LAKAGRANSDCKYGGHERKYWSAGAESVGLPERKAIPVAAKSVFNHDVGWDRMTFVSPQKRRDY
jgi:hypothetical protein